MSNIQYFFSSLVDTFNCTIQTKHNLEGSFVEQLSLLRGWLETSFREVNVQIGDLRRKMISIEDSVEHLRETVVKKRSKKVTRPPLK